MNSLDPVSSKIPSRRLRAIRQVWRNENPPTVVVAQRARDVQDSDSVANEVLDLVLRLGQALLSVGASVADVTSTTLRVAAAYGLTSCQVDVVFTSITVSVTRDDGDFMTGTRVAKIRTADYSRLAALDELGYRIAHKGLDLQTAMKELDRIVHAPHPYRRWIATAALAGMAACIAGTMGGGPTTAVIAALTTAAIDRLLRRLNSWGLPAFFQQVAGASLATVIAVTLILLDPHLPLNLRPSLVVASGIVVLLAGLATVGAAQDALTGFYLTSAARTFEVVLLSLGIVVGVAAVLRVTQAVAHESLDVTHLPPATGVPVGLKILLAGGVAACWAVGSYARLFTAFVGAAAGILAFGLYSSVLDLGAGAAIAAGVGALGVGVFAELVGSQRGVSPLVVAICGVTPLLPGLAVYRGTFALVEQSTDAGLALLFGAMSVGLGIAAGVALGTFLAQPLMGQYDRWDRRVRRRAKAQRD